MIDRHYSVLNYQPIDFINKYNFNYTVGNIVKYVSRIYNIKRADADIISSIERLRFYINNTIKNLASWKRVKYSEEELYKYCEINEFTPEQTNLLIVYFNAITAKDYLTLKVLEMNLENNFLNIP